MRTYQQINEQYEQVIARKNEVDRRHENGIYDRYVHPVLTREHIPPFWMYDANPATNPHMMQRLGINAVFNSGAMLLDGKYTLVARVEGMDRKSFFAVAQSDRPTEGFRFWDYPVVLPDTCPEETNVYDMRLTQHEDGWIYGVFCSESKDATVNDLSAAVAAAGIVRTKDLKTWERLPNLVTLRSPQQRNVVLHPRFVDGKYAFYTRPMDDFIETGSGGGIGFGLCEDITHAVIDEEKMTSIRRYHTITESKNGAGATPIYTDRGWIHIAHGVRNTAAGLRYVIYAFATALDDPSRVIAEPGGYLIAPMDEERVGDVSNVTFTNGAIDTPDGQVYIYYASSDTRLHVAHTTVEKLVDYVFGTPADALRSPDCVKQRCALIEKNLAFLNQKRGLKGTGSMQHHPEQDILLCYTVDAFGHIPNDKELFRPAVGYYQDGELKDFMYDSFIFLSSPNYLYDYFPGGYKHKDLNMQDFLNFIGEEMKEGFAIDALNAAVGEAKAKLGRPDYKAHVFMSLLYPANTVKEFGVVEGKMRDLSVLEDRLAALRWMADESIRQFNEKHFEHVSLSGFYWFCEEMEYEDQNKEMTQATTAYIRSIGYKTCWCPWFGAPGFADWKELGFDIATQQANFFPEHRKDWPNRGTQERLPAVAEWTRKIGIGVGMEMSDAEHESAEVFKQYLETGAREGFMLYPHIYYLGRGPKVLNNIFTSPDPYVRSVYHELYRYIRRTLKPEDVSM